MALIISKILLLNGPKYWCRVKADHLLAEMKAPNTPLYTYVWKDDTPVSVIVHQAAQQAANPTQTITSTADQIIYLEVDHLNTPRVGRNQSNVVVWSWDSDAFGSTLANSDPDGDNFKTIVNLRFAGQYYDQESGLHYNHHRYYDPQSGGRYSSADPIGLDGGLNLFNYANASPLRFTDPSGKVFIAPAIYYGALGLATAGAAWWSASHPPAMSSGAGSDGDFPFAGSKPSSGGSDKGCEPDDKCEKLNKTDTDTCNGITRLRGSTAGRRCHASATQRYAACLRGQPIPPLDTWNN